MNFFKTTALALAMIAAPLAGAVSAKTLTYDFTGHGQSASSFDFTSEGVDLTVKGYSSLGDHLFPGTLTRWSHGLGLRSIFDGNHEIDGEGLAEYLSFSFSKDIDWLESLTFDFVDHKDSFKIFNVKDHKLNEIFDSKISRDETGKVTFAFADGTDLSGSHFFLGATGKHDDYKLRGLTASLTDIAPVPLPAGGLLLVSGLVGIGIARHRRRAKAA